MKIVIITKYTPNDGSIWVGAVLGPVTKKQRKALRKAFNCDGEGETPEDDEDSSNLFFREVEVSTIKDLELLNASDYFDNPEETQ